MIRVTFENGKVETFDTMENSGFDFKFKNVRGDVVEVAKYNEVKYIKAKK